MIFHFESPVLIGSEHIPLYKFSLYSYHSDLDTLIVG